MTQSIAKNRKKCWEELPICIKNFSEKWMSDILTFSIWKIHPQIIFWHQSFVMVTHVNMFFILGMKRSRLSTCMSDIKHVTLQFKFSSTSRIIDLILIFRENSLKVQIFQFQFFGLVGTSQFQVSTGCWSLDLELEKKKSSNTVRLIRDTSLPFEVWMIGSQGSVFHDIRSNLRTLIHNLIMIMILLLSLKFQHSDLCLSLLSTTTKRK